MKLKNVLLLLSVIFLCLMLSGISFALSGGPDQFGYEYKDSVLGKWTDISSTGTLLKQYKDELSDPINIGFSFKFYGNKFSEVTIASNGILTFSPEAYRRGCTTNGKTTGQALPTQLGCAENVIAGLWDYLSPNQG